MLAFAADVREGRVRGAHGQPMTKRGQYRHRRLRPRSGNGGARLGAVRPAGSALPLRLQRRRRRHRRHAARTRAGADPVHRFLQDLHHPGDDDQRPDGARLDRRLRWGEGAVADHFAAVSTRARQGRRFGVEVDGGASASGTGSAGAIRSGRASACRWRSPSGRNTISNFSAAARRSTSTSAGRIPIPGASASAWLSSQPPATILRLLASGTPTSSLSSTTFAPSASIKTINGAPTASAESTLSGTPPLMSSATSAPFSATPSSKPISR